MLEIGCGRGEAISLICDAVPDARVTGIDRSPTMVASSRDRNAEHVAAGRATILLGELDTVLAGNDRYDVVFAVNVNRFWTKPVVPALRALRRMLSPGGAMYLFYEAPTAEKVREIGETVLLGLPPAGVLETEQFVPDAGDGRLLGIKGVVR